MPPRPRTAAAAAAAVPAEAATQSPLQGLAARTTQYETWDQLVAEALAGQKPYVLPMPDGPVEVACPTGRQMEIFVAADQQGDRMGAAVAIFGAEMAPRFLQAVGDLPWFVPGRIIEKILAYYGIQQVDLPNS